MVHRRWQLPLILFVLILALIVVGCAKRPAAVVTATAAPSPGAQSPTLSPPPPPVVAPAAPEPAPVEAPPAPVMPAEAAPPLPQEFTANDALRDIHFDFDKYDIRPGDAEILNASTAWMKANPDYVMLIEGHCDERGTNDYNLALGDHRARAALNYILARGVTASRLTTLSYGEERPACIERAEACWARNRRAHFLVKLATPPR